MSISHHPSDALVLAYAAGTLDPGEHIAIATHLVGCSQCRAFAASVESAGGSQLGELAPAPMSADAFSRLEAMLDAPELPRPTPPPPEPRLGSVDGLPSYVRRLHAAPWRWVAPGMHIQRLTPPAASKTRVFLLKAKAGMRLFPHGHDGVEMTCVLTGSFSHDGHRYGAGDFDWGDDDALHDIHIGAESECICLVAMRGKLQLRGLPGRMIQPFITI